MDNFTFYAPTYFVFGKDTDVYKRQISGYMTM